MVLKTINKNPIENQHWGNIAQGIAIELNLLMVEKQIEPFLFNQSGVM